MATGETVGELLGRCLRAAGASRIFGAPHDGLTGIPGLAHVRVDEPGLAAVLADMHGRVVGGAGVALLADRTLRLSARPDGDPFRHRVTDAADLPYAVAEWSVGSVVGCTELVVDIDLDAPAPAGAAPLDVSPAGRMLRLGAEFVDQRLAVLVGPGVVRADEVAALHAFASQAGAGVVNSWGAKGVFRWDDPHHFGTAGLQERDFELAGFADADLIVAAGVDPDETPPARWQLSQVLEVEPFQLVALAHTWPPRDPPSRRPALYEVLAAALAPLYESDSVPLSPARAAADLGTLVARAGTVVADPGPAGFWVARTLPTTRLGSVVVPATGGPGVAVAGAVASALSGTPAVAVTTFPLDDRSRALVELAAAWSTDVVVAAWGGSSDAADPAAVRRSLRDAQRRPGPTVVEVPVDLDATRVLVDVAGPVVAWTGS